MGIKKAYTHSATVPTLAANHYIIVKHHHVQYINNTINYLWS